MSAKDAPRGGGYLYRGQCEFGCAFHYPCCECGEPHIGSHRPSCSHYGSGSGFRCRYCEKAEGLCAEHQTKAVAS